MARSKLVGPVLSEILIEEMEFHFSGSLPPPTPLYQPKPSLWERNGANICMLAPQLWNVLPTQSSLPLLTFPTATSKEPSRKLPTFSGIATHTSLYYNAHCDRFRTVLSEFPAQLYSVRAETTICLFFNVESSTTIPMLGPSISLTE